MNPLFNTQVQMLKSFNSLLIDKVQCVSSGNILPEFLLAHCTCMNFCWHDGLVQESSSYAFALAGYFFFSKSLNPPPPPPSEVKWSAPKEVPKTTLQSFGGGGGSRNPSTVKGLEHIHKSKMADNTAKTF